jgi:group I intron endonuclease
MFEVYCLTSPSGKQYVGFTSRGVDKRWAAHVQDAKRRNAKDAKNGPLQIAIRKYGPESFTRSLLERMTTEAGAKRAEQLWIKELGTFGRGGYNATLGGEGALGWAPSEETCAKISKAHSGKVLSLEHRAKISKGGLGKKRSPETCARMAEAARRRTSNRAHSPETRAKISQANIARWAQRKLETAGRE